MVGEKVASFDQYLRYCYESGTNFVFSIQCTVENLCFATTSSNEVVSVLEMAGSAGHLKSK